MLKKDKPGLSPVKRIAIVGIMAATVECAKLALAALPNIEVVSLLLAVYGFVFGDLGILAAFVFCAIEPMIWGFGPWVISYFLYWPLIPFVFSLLSKRKGEKNLSEVKKTIKIPLVPTATIFAMTLWFGILTSLVDVGLFTGNFDRFFWRFGVYYIRGIAFYIMHVVSNVIIFAFSFEPLSRAFHKIKKSVI